MSFTPTKRGVALAPKELKLARALRHQADKGEINLSRASRVAGIDLREAQKLMRTEFFRAYMFHYFDSRGTFEKAFSKLDAKLDAKVPHRFGRKTKMIDDHPTQMDAVKEVMKIGGAYAPIEQHVETTTTTTIDFSGEPIAVLHYVAAFGVLPNAAARRILLEGTPEERRRLLTSQTETIEGNIMNDESPPKPED